jgi:hypothetical protein
LIKILEKINETMANEGLLSWWQNVKETLWEPEKATARDNEKYAGLLKTVEAAMAQVALVDLSNLFVPGRIISLYESSVEGKIINCAAYVEASHKVCAINIMLLVFANAARTMLMLLSPLFHAYILVASRYRSCWHHDIGPLYYCL